LRYFSDAYKALVQNVPEDTKSATSRDITEWLGEIVRQVDSSLLDEWEMLSHPAELQDAAARGQRPVARGHDEAPALTANTRAFRVMVRNAAFRRAELAARRDWRALEELDQGEGWDAARWEAAFQPYFAEHPGIGTGADARGPDLWQLGEEGRLWRARLVLDDPAGFREWAIVMAVDLDASDRLGEAVLRPLAIERAR
jgi:hypothetical protein